jgi:hypothetical protein
MEENRYTYIRGFYSSFKEDGMNWMLGISQTLAVIFILQASAWAQTISITGTVVDNASSQGIANAKVKLVEFPGCTTRTDATGAFTLGGTASASHSKNAINLIDKISLRDNALSIKVSNNQIPITVDVFNLLGSRLQHLEPSTNQLNTIEIANLWQTPGLYYVKVRIGNDQRILSNFGSNTTASISSHINSNKSSLAKIAAVYTIEAGASGYDSKQVSMTGVTGSAGTIRLSTNIQAPGTWKNVTPPVLDSLIRAGKSWGGMHRILADPVRLSDLYANCDGQGTWKSTDYGVNWVKVSTGTNADKVNSGRQWAACIDPNKNRDPSTMPAIFVGQGYGAGCVWKSTDGGINWTNIWDNNIFAPDGITNISGDVGGDVGGFQITDTTGANHLITFMHSYWGTGGNNGLFETTDGGGKWIVHRAQTFNFQPHADGAFPLDGKTWFVTHGTTYPNNEVYRTTDGGESWVVSANNLYIGGGMWVGSTYYASGSTMCKTTDMGVTWTKMFTAGAMGTMCVTATNNIYISSGDRASGTLDFRHASVNNTVVWTVDPIPNKADMYWGKGNNQDIGSGTLYHMSATHDGTHAIILSGNWMAGVWRYVEP